MWETDIFVDLLGASGATYRFRSWDDAGQSPMAGNFVVIEGRGAGLQVLMVGVSNDVSKAEAQATSAGLGGRPLFVRLNVGRATRYSEHHDIVAQYSPGKVFDAES